MLCRVLELICNYCCFGAGAGAGAVAGADDSAFGCAFGALARSARLSALLSRRVAHSGLIFDAFASMQLRRAGPFVSPHNDWTSVAHADRLA